MGICELLLKMLLLLLLLLKLLLLKLLLLKLQLLQLLPSLLARRRALPCPRVRGRTPSFSLARLFAMLPGMPVLGPLL